MHADTILYNGKIYTLHEEQPLVSALAIRDGKIVAAGHDEEIEGTLRPGGDAVNLGGRTVVPGLVDAHVHLSSYAHSLHMIDLRGVASPQEAVERVAERAAQTPPGEWIRGHGWSQERWPDRAFPRAGQIDALVSRHPVYLTTQSLHAAWVNSRALQQAGITAQTPDPPGGTIGRDEAGNPNGMLLETAMDLVSDEIPSPAPETVAERVGTAIEQAHRSGLTGIHDFDGAAAFRAYQILRARDDLTLRIVKNIPVSLLDQALELGLRWGFGDDFLRIGGVKTFADGALGPRTAWMVEAYEGEPDNYGICVTDPEEITENVRRASAAGLPSTVHAIGDRAVHHVLNAYETVRREEARQLRHRIEHVQLIHPDDAHRLAELNVIASMQPNHATSDMGMADDYWGERADYAYNIRLQLDAGAPIALGSDAPVEPIEPLPNIHAAVTRRRPDGSPGPDGWRAGAQGRRCLSVEEAVRGFTLGPAYAAGMERRLGRLRPGYLADLVVLGQDIFHSEPMTIHETPVLGTMVNGSWVYRNF